MLSLLLQAASISLPTHKNDPRGFWLGCIGIREDGAKVTARNGAVEFQSTIDKHQLFNYAHAEGRVLRKLGKGGVLFVARVSRKDKSLAMARPCDMCRLKLKMNKVSKVYYTINDNQYGVWYVKDDYDRVYTV